MASPRRSAWAGSMGSSLAGPLSLTVGGWAAGASKAWASILATCALAASSCFVSFAFSDGLSLGSLSWLSRSSMSWRRFLGTKSAAASSGTEGIVEKSMGANVWALRRAEPASRIPCTARSAGLVSRTWTFSGSSGSGGVCALASASKSGWPDLRAASISPPLVSTREAASLASPMSPGLTSAMPCWVLARQAASVGSLILGAAGVVAAPPPPLPPVFFASAPPPPPPPALPWTPALAAPELMGPAGLAFVADFSLKPGFTGVTAGVVEAGTTAR